MLALLSGARVGAALERLAHAAALLHATALATDAPVQLVRCAVCVAMRRRVRSVHVCMPVPALLTWTACRRDRGGDADPAFCELEPSCAALHAGGPPQPADAEQSSSSAAVAFMVAPGLRARGRVLRRCRVVLQPRAAAPAPAPVPAAGGRASERGGVA